MKWPKVKLDSIKADLRYAFVGGPFGSNLTTRDYVEEGVPVIRGNNLPADRTFLDDDFVFVTEEKAGKLQSNTAYPGDVIFTQRGTLGQVGIIPLEAKFSRYVISQSQMKLSVNLEKADARFVYYFFRMPSTVQSVINHALTSGVPHINHGVASSDAIVIRPASEELCGLVLLTVSSDQFVAQASQTMREGSKMPRADWKLMKQYAVAVPPAGLLGSFNGIVESITEQLKMLTFQTQKLRTARDLLLPRLMSGEIAV